MRNVKETWGTTSTQWLLSCLPALLRGGQTQTGASRALCIWLKWLKPARGIGGEIILKQYKLGWNTKAEEFLLGTSVWNSVQGRENWPNIFSLLKTEGASRRLLLKRPDVKWELLSKCLQRAPTRRSNYENQQKILCRLHLLQSK